LQIWVKRISIDKKRGGTIEYKLPLAVLKKEDRSTMSGPRDAVLSMGQIGCPSRTLLKTGKAFYLSFRSVN